MRKPIAVIAALALFAGLICAAVPSSTAAAGGRATHVRHLVLTRISLYRTGRHSFAGVDRIRDRATGRIVGVDRYTGTRRPHTRVVRLRLRITLRHGTMRAVLTEGPHRVRGRVITGSGAYRSARGTITGHRVGTRRTVVTVRYSRGVPPSPTVSEHLRRYPYLTDVVRGNATVNFATDASVTAASATIGPAGGACTTIRRTGSKTGVSVNGVAENQWKVRFTGLRPGRRYCYRILAGSATNPGPILVHANSAAVFRTLPTRRSASFAFAVLGDWGATNGSGTNPAQAHLDARIASSGALFALGAGDTAYPDGSQTNYGDLKQRGPNLSSVFGPRFFTRIGDGIPMYNALGNHGLSPTFLNTWPQPTAPALSGGRSQMDAYPSVNGSRPTSYPSVWYAFNAGRARIYVLDAAWADTNRGTGTLYADDHAAHWRASSPEYRWLSSDLATHPRGLKIAVMHFPMYADSRTEGTDPFLHGPGSVGALLTKHHVRLVFNGHLHAYQRNRRHPGDSFVSYVTGGGGESLEPVGGGGCSRYDAYAIGWSSTTRRGSRCGAATAPATAGQVFHFLLVRVRRSSVTVTPTASTGRTFDVHTYHF